MVLQWIVAIRNAGYIKIDICKTQEIQFTNLLTCIVLFHYPNLPEFDGFGMRVLFQLRHGMLKKLISW